MWCTYMNCFNHKREKKRSYFQLRDFVACPLRREVILVIYKIQNLSAGFHQIHNARIQSDF